MIENSYRDSHQGKGIDYHCLFKNNPRRKLIWQLEQNFVYKFFIEQFKDKTTTHLDFACGTGRWLEFIKQYSASSLGVDISPSMLKVAKQNNPELEFIEGDITQNDLLGNRKFDIITAFRFFPNAEPKLRKQVLDVLVTHLNPGGFIIFNNHTNYNSFRSRLTRAVTLGRKGHFGTPMCELESLMNEYHLEKIKVQGIGYLPELETRLLPFRKLINCVEKGLSYISPINSLAENVVYVYCQK